MRLRIAEIKTMGCGFLAVTAIGLFFGEAQAVSAQQVSKISLKVGEIKCNKLKKQVNPVGVNKTFSRPQIIHAWFNGETQVFCFEGLKEGETRVTFTGTYTADANRPAPGTNNGGGMTGGVGGQQGGQTFNVPLDLTVLPRGEAIMNPNAFRAQVVRGKHVDYPIEAVLGLEAANRPANQARWRNVALIATENGIARADLLNKGNDRSAIRVTGLGLGNITLTLEGEVLKTGGWEMVKRPIAITVSDDPNAELQTDPWIDGMQRRLQELKRTADQVGKDERKITYSVRNIEKFITPVTTAITRERALENEREWRLARLENLRDEANNAIVKLREKHAEIANEVRPIQWNSAPYDLNMFHSTMPATRTFFCPPNPEKRFSSIGVWGTDRYSANSTLCVAALHDRAVGLEGGNIVVKFHQGSSGDKFLGSSKNGVTTGEVGWNYGWFVFIK